MKKNKKKKFFSKKRFFPKLLTIILLSISLVGITYAIDIIGDYIKTQPSTGTGTNQNKITFSRHKTTYYINKDNDNILKGDMLRGYYYDNIYGFFRLDWSQDTTKNVHINSGPSHIGSCTDAYSFTGSAYSKYMGEIKFNDTGSGTLVYYCKTNSKIFGNTNSNNLGKQNLDGIEIKIKQKQVINNIEDKLDISNTTDYIENNNSIKSNYNWNNNNIGGGDKYEIENSTIKDSNNLDESVFWIIK